MPFLTKYFFAIAIFCVPFVCLSQTTDSTYKKVDDYVKALGKMDTLNMGTISAKLTKPFSDNTDKVRAIFTWVATNLTLDVKAAKNGNREKQYYAEDALKTRKTTAAGYASLFQDMCSVAKIRCLTVDGYVKTKVEEINEKPDEFNHTWAVVQLGRSPDTWFYVDPAMASGYTDDKNTIFTPYFNDAYFFSDRKIFNLQHFPDNTAWLLGSGTKNVNDFFSLPLVRNEAFQFGVSEMTPITGYIKTKVGKPVNFSIKFNTDITVEIVALKIGTDRKSKTKTVNYSIRNNFIVFENKFETADDFPVAVLINNKEVLKYYIEVTE